MQTNPMLLVSLGAILSSVTRLFPWVPRKLRRVAFEKHIPSIMSTETTLKAVVELGKEQSGEQALQAAEAVLREVEARMSVWMGVTELARFNAAGAGEKVPLSAETLSVLRIAQEITKQTEGAFDPTCRPVLEFWRECSAADREPNSGKLSRALDRVGWHLIRLHERSAEKLQDGISVDLGGIAKGYAVERAAEAMRNAGACGGMVQSGGDLYVFGPAEHSSKWGIGINDPFDPQGKLRPEVLFLTNRAVSTSGNYRRFFAIRDRRHSHILDPRNGKPVDAVPQVTTVAGSAMISEGWSTALSVLGPEGLTLLPAGVEAMLITHDGSGPQVHKSEHFDELVCPQLSA